MKKIFFALFLSALIFSNINVIAQAWNVGGNALAAAGRIGATTNRPVVFITNNQERGRVDSNGNWGFGTLSSSDKVRINTPTGSIPLRAMVNGQTAFLVHSGGGVSIGSNTTPPANGLYVSGETRLVGAYAATISSAPNMYVNASGQIMRSTVPVGAGWLLGGNTGTVDGTSFIGTTDNLPLNFRVNNQKAGRIDHLKFNTFYGYQAGNSNTTGIDNSANGYQALFSNTTGGYNTANGYQVLYSNATGDYNTANGYQALFSNTSGIYNTANGFQALHDNTTGGYNTAVGEYALYRNTNGYRNAAIGDGTLSFNTTGYQNTAIGSAALLLNTTGTNNTASGYLTLANNRTGSLNTATGVSALDQNTTGSLNTANGYQAIYLNTTGFSNTATGAYALKSNTTGYENTASGESALQSNTTGHWNTANGRFALADNTGGYGNTGSGCRALAGNTSGYDNTAIGYGALESNTTGDYNTALGSHSGASPGYITNATALGFNAIVNNSDKVRIGNINVTVVESAAGSWTTSDGRFKTNITEEVKGLEFIKLLRPVLYNFDVNKFDAFLTQNYPDSIKARRKEMMNKTPSKLSAIRQTGFIAQEVEIAAKKSGYNFNGVHAPENPTDNYSISYEKLVVPLVKAVQELSNKNDALQSQNNSLQLQNDVLKTRLDKIEQMLTSNSRTFESISGARLEQNAPNPYKRSTIINYYVPFNTGNAVLKITDMKGSLLKTFNLNEGQGQVTLQPGQLAAGTYQYSLIIHGRLTDTKQMILIR